MLRRQSKNGDNEKNAKGKFDMTCRNKRREGERKKCVCVWEAESHSLSHR